MPIPTRAPNFNSAEPDSAWWLYYEGDPGNLNEAVVFATTGYYAVRALQAALSRQTIRVRKAYRSGGPLGGVSLGVGGVGGANTDFGAVQIDGSWGPTTNATLWRLIAEQASPSIGSSPTSSADFDPVTLRYLDAIEQSAKDRRPTPLAIEAAAWLLVHQDRPSWRSQMLPSPKVGIPDSMRSSVVPPPWNASPPRPTRVVSAVDMRSWAAFDIAPALPATDGTPVRGGQQPPQPPSSPSLVVPIAAGVGVAALLAGIAFVAMRKKEDDSPSPVYANDVEEPMPTPPPRRPAPLPVRRTRR